MTVRQVPPNINDPNLRGFLNELRTALGNAGDQISRLTGDVLRLGGGGGGGGGNPPGNPPGPEKPPVGDGLPPPAPTSLQAVPGAFSITLVWTNPVIPDLAATEVWAQRSFSAWNSAYEYLANAKVLVNGVVYRSRKAQDVNPTTNVVTLNKGFNPPSSPDWWQATTLNATEPSKVGESAGLSWIHDGLTPGETWAYWVRNRDIENLFSTFFPPDNTGIIATTTLDPGAYLDLLTNSITATQLYRDLGQRINLIDGPPELVNSVNNRTTAVYNELDGVIDKIVDGTTDITVKTDTGFKSLRALKTSTENSAAAILAINDVSATSTSASARSLSGMVAKVDSPTTGLAAAQGYIAQLNKIDVTSTSANVQELVGLRAKVNDPDTGLEKAVANINAINDIKVTSTSAAAQKIATLDATVNTGPTSLTAQIAELNNVSVDSTSANASKLAQVFASNATKVSVFFQVNNPPTTERAVGDLWYDTDDGNKQYRWSGSAWVVYRDSAKTYTGNAGGTTPTLGSTAAAPLYAGDLFVDTSSETVNGQSVPRNKTWRWSGTAWVDISNGSYSEAKASALVTNLEQTKIGYSTRNDTGQVWDANGAVKNKETADAWNAGPNNVPKVTWNIGLPMATAVKQVSVTVPGVCYRNGAISGETSQGACELEVNGAKGVWMPAGTAALEQQFIAQQEVNGRLYSQYTVKLDTNGWVSGFGLANAQQSDGTVVSDFGIRADRFWIAAPNTPNVNGYALAVTNASNGQVLTTTGVRGDVNNPFRAYFYLSGISAADAKIKTGDWITLKDIYYSNRTTPNDYYNQSWQVSYAGSNQIEFLIPTDLPGNPYDPGFGFATNAADPSKSDPPRVVPGNRLPLIVTTTQRRYNGVTIPAGVFMNTAFIVDASITNAKIYGHIKSDNFTGDVNNPHLTPGDAGWCINKNGNAVFNTAVWRNYIKSQNFDGNINSGGLITTDGQYGWAIDQSGKAVFNTVIVRNPSRNIAEGILAGRGGTVWGSIGTIDNGATQQLGYFDYYTTIKYPSDAYFVVTFSAQLPMYLHYLQVVIEHGSWTEYVTLYDDYVSGEGGDLAARAFSASFTSWVDIGSWNFVRLRIYYRVRSGGTQPFQNVRINVFEMYR